MISKVTNEDCMTLMAGYPDKHFDLAVVDPPYGMIGNVFCTTAKDFMMPGCVAAYVDRGGASGFSLGERPTKNYFDELFRVTKNQIIWGMQYFVDNLRPTQCVVIWDKQIPDGVRFSDAELAWTSFKFRVSIYKKRNINGGRIHPTQKPIHLYDWIFKNYAQPGQLILDTHLGSGSSRIAADRAGLDFVACELDADYFEAQEKRFKQYKSQLTIFPNQ